MQPKPFAFVIMPFDKSFNDVYLLGIKPACESAGYYCERLDEQIFKETMLERIYNQIAKADLIIADMTGRNPNVFYEAGYAHALGKQVILLTRNAEDIPFDLKHYFHIVYSDGITSLKETLTSRATYFLKNPHVPSTDPFAYLAISVNGTAINFEVQSHSISADRVLIRHRTAIRIKVTGEIPVTSNREADATILLETDRNFRTCGDFTNGDTSLIYKSIPTNAGTLYIHKPINILSVRPGEPDLTIFDAFIYNQMDDVTHTEATLIIILSGILKKIKLNILIRDHGQSEDI